MQLFEEFFSFGDYGDKYSMLASEMIAGNACLVSYNDKVLRAEFKVKPLNREMRICLVDYGTTVVVDISQCRRINKYFAAIPKRCFPGALELIEPNIDNDDGSTLVERFCEMVQNRPLCGYVSKVDRAVRRHRNRFYLCGSMTHSIIIFRFAEWSGANDSYCYHGREERRNRQSEINQIVKNSKWSYYSAFCILNRTKNQ